MIERLTGTLAVVDADGGVIDVGGVGFRLEMSRTTLRSLPEVGGDASVLTYLHVREEALHLFGFATVDERELFLRLISVSKIGPRLALAALSIRSPRELRQAIAAGDVALFQSVPGIGKKTAERLILELREKMLELEGAGPAAAGVGVDDANLALARAALAELGLTASEAEQLLRDADPDASVDQIVRAALRRRA